MRIKVIAFHLNARRKQHGLAASWEVLRYNKKKVFRERNLIGFWFALTGSGESVGDTDLPS